MTHCAALTTYKYEICHGGIIENASSLGEIDSMIQTSQSILPLIEAI
jgi:hypothetical protein